MSRCKANGAKTEESALLKLFNKIARSANEPADVTRKNMEALIAAGKVIVSYKLGKAKIEFNHE